MKKPPKSLIICGKKRTITYDPTTSGGMCMLDTGAITIGTQSKGEILETIIHEVCELILHEHGHRYSKYVEGNDGLRFVMDHAQFELFIKELTAVVEQIRN